MPYDLECLGRKPPFEPLSCPHHRQGICRASFSAMPTDRRRQALYCTNEDHDRCPLFLARQLRASRPRHAGRSRLECARP